MIIAQISDTHIVPEGHAWKSLPETNVADRLKLIVQNLNQLNPRPDIVVHTGDAIDHGGIESYDRLKEILSPLTMPFYIVPGNHDDREDMRKAFQHKSYMPSQGFIQYVIDDHDVRLIALDTVVQNQPQGLLCEDRIAWLTSILQQNTLKPTLIFMHHPLLESGQALLDKVKCFTPDDFESLISSFPNVIGIIAGHYHKTCATIFGNTLCFTGPSVAPVHYFEKYSDETTKVIELVRPAFALHKWISGFNILSEVVQTLETKNRLTVLKDS